MCGLTREANPRDALPRREMAGFASAQAPRVFAMTERDDARHLFPDPVIAPLATSRFQMNSTISAPMVAVMKPAPWSGP